MLTRYIVTAVLAASAIVGANKPAAAADNTGVSIEQSNVQEVIPSDREPQQYAELAAAAEANQDSSTALVAAQWFASTCYTFRGPTCPLLNLVPPGDSCVCYFPGLPPLVGVAY